MFFNNDYGMDLIAALRKGDEREILLAKEIDRNWQKTIGKIKRDEALQLVERGNYTTRVILTEHPDGHVREKALRFFKPDETAALIPLLRRANDWVRPIALLASEAATNLLPKATDAEISEALPHIFALTNQWRFDHRNLIQTYCGQVFQRPGLARKIRRANGSGALGIWAYRNLVGENETAEAIVREGLRNPQIVVRIQSARKLAEDPGQWPNLLGSKNAAIRQIALEIAPPEAREAALLDPHPSVRNDARYLLGKRDYAAFYRSKLPHPAAISGLGEHGVRADAETIRPFLIDPDPEIRWRALQAFARLAEKDATNEVLVALQDPSRKVLRAVFAALENLPVSLEPEQILELGLNRRYTWALMNRCARWPALIFVLEDLSRFPAAEAWVEKWAVTVNKHPVQPHPDEFERVTALLNRLSDPTQELLSQSIRPWAPR